MPLNMSGKWFIKGLWPDAEEAIDYDRMEAAREHKTENHHRRASALPLQIDFGALCQCGQGSRGDFLGLIWRITPV